ncbi:MAG: tryptophan--tRNA ligase [Clostridia bacterium]
MDENNKKRILTGDRPTGRLHIGHYLGSLENRVKLQDEYEQYILVADVQALTDNFNNPEKVRKNVREVVTDYLAAGIDPEKTTIFLQSMVPEIAELTVFYSNLVTVSRLQRNPTVKTEISQKKEIFGSEGESVTYGFLGYPVSQAADITAFMGEIIPVGEDQVPVIEQSREIVRKFNSIYGDTLVEPEAVLSKNCRVKGLDGNTKMGKSLGNAIFLADSDEEVERKIMGAVTDTTKIKKEDPANPDICMVGYYHNLFSENKEEIFKECRNGARGCVACKKELTKNFLESLKIVRERRRYYEARPECIDKILIEGTEKARKVAKETMVKVRKAMKIDYFTEEEK